MINSGKSIKAFLSLIVLGGVGFFFYEAFQKNWAHIREHPLKLDLFFIAPSFILVVVTYLLATYGWFLALNSLSTGSRITLSQSIATVHTSNLTKYIPGKVWSYALQTYWLVNKGFSKSLVLYVNLINIYVSLVTSTIVGLAYLLFSPIVLSFSLTLSLLTTVLLVDVFFIKYNAVIFNGIISVANKILKRDIKYFQVPHKLMVSLHVIHFVAALCFGMCAYLLSLGIGFHVGTDKILLVMASLLLSDVIGFMSVIVPGGLGVREGIMYLMLKDVSTGALSLILPFAARIVSMLSDISLGAIAFALQNKYKNAVQFEKTNGHLRHSDVIDKS